MEYLLIACPMIVLILSALFSYKAVQRGTKTKKALIAQLVSFGAVYLIAFIIPMAASAFGGDAIKGLPEAVQVAISQSQGWGLIASALAMGISTIGGGMAIASAAPAAIGATSEDPKVFGKALIFVVFGESIALMGFIISILIWTKC